VGGSSETALGLDGLFDLHGAVVEHRGAHRICL
jgi:hypothetical protein